MKLAPSKSTVYVANLPYSLTNNDLHKILEKYGKVVKVTVAKNEKRMSKGIAFVQFLEREKAVDCAKALNGKKLLDRTITASIAIDNGRAADFIRRKNYPDKSRCYECGEFGHLSYSCPKNAFGDREPPKKKEKRFLKKKKRPKMEEEPEESEDEMDDPELDSLSAAIRYQAEKAEAEKFGSGSGVQKHSTKKRIHRNNYFSDEEEMSLKLSRSFARVNEESTAFSHPLLNKKVENILTEYPSMERGSQKAKVAPLYHIAKNVKLVQDEIEEMEAITEEHKGDKEMMEMASNDIALLESRLMELEKEFIDRLIPAEPIEERGVMIELTAGVGGQEAMLFTSDLLHMYRQYTQFRGWACDVIECDHTGLGGVRHASMAIEGDAAYRSLQYEAGVHRVQRVPRTEKAGRIHTSTVAVAVLPQPTEVEVCIKTGDLKIETMRASGAGGQHVNTTDSAVRVTHIPTGLVVECQTQRSQHRNKEIAIQGIRTKLYQQEFKQQLEKTIKTRKLQMGSSGRSEKIRTYNYQQDRITDHRIGLSVHNLPGVMQGEEELHQLIEHLNETDRMDRLMEALNDT